MCVGARSGVCVGVLLISSMCSACICTARTRRCHSAFCTQVAAALCSGQSADASHLLLGAVSRCSVSRCSSSIASCGGPGQWGIAQVPCAGGWDGCQPLSVHPLRPAPARRPAHQMYTRNYCLRARLSSSTCCCARRWCGVSTRAHDENSTAEPLLHRLRRRS